MTATDPSTAARRMLLVHAHPDDECIATGVTMARYVDEGVGVTLLTCTRGEEGEVLVPELEQLAADRDDTLGEHRVGELDAAMSVLGVRDHRFLGGAGRWRDSGMMGEPSNDRPDAFWQADLLEASAEVARVIREVRPQVLVTYDTSGGYGHPDHIQAHRVAMYGAVLAAAPAFRPDLGLAWDVRKIYWAGIPRSFVKEGIATLVAEGKSGFFGMESPEQVDELPFLVDDDLITARIQAYDLEPRKLAALREHRTQVTPDAVFFQLAEAAGPAPMGTEFFSLVKGEAGTTSLGADGRETDLFDGVA